MKFSKKEIKADELGEPLSPYPSEEEGKQEISIYHPSYTFLVKLVKTITKVVPEAAQDIKNLASSYPFKTVDDIGDLTAKIWTLAITKYNIPREWLIKNLPEKKIKGNLNKKAIAPRPTLEEMQARNNKWINESLLKYEQATDPRSKKWWYEEAQRYFWNSLTSEERKKIRDEMSKKADLWPAQEAASEGTLSQAPGQIGLNPLQEKDTSVSGPNPNDVVDKDKLWGIVSDQFFGQHLRWSEVIKQIRSIYPNVTDSVILSLKDRVKKSLDNQMGMIGSKKVAAIGFGMWMSPSGEIIDVGSHPNYAFDNAKELGLQNIPTEITDENVGSTYKSLMEQMFQKGWVRLRLMSNELDIELYDLQATPDMLNDFIIEHPTKQIRVANAWGDDVRLDYDSVIENGLQKAVNLENQPEEEQIAASKKISKRHLNMDQVIKILDSKENKVDHIDFTDSTIELIDGTKLTFDEAAQKAMELSKKADQEVLCPNCGRLREYTDVIQDGKCDQCDKDLFRGDEFSKTDWCVNPSLGAGPFDSPEDHGAKPQKGSFPSLSWQPAGEESKDEEPYSNIASSKKLSKLDKQANPPSRFWIAPDGKEYAFNMIHPVWIRSEEGKKALREYGLDNRIQIYALEKQMFEEGWSRVSNEPAGTGFVIEVGNLQNIPSYLEDFVIKYFKQGDRVIIGTEKSGDFAVITEPFISLQKAINRHLRNPVNASLKQAAVSGPVIRDILEIVESSGGITYSLSKGNLHGAKLYSVSTHPERTKVVDGVVDFNDIENYIEANEDLLSDPNNALGIWSHEGKVWYDVVQTVSDLEQAKELGIKFNQIAVWDLANSQEIPTGGTGERVAFSKKDIVKKAEESPLTEEQANEISSVSCPAYVIAVNNFYEAFKRGHDRNRAIDYAIFSVKNLEKIDEKKLVEFINTYLPVK